MINPAANTPKLAIKDSNGVFQGKNTSPSFEATTPYRVKL
jgi:hypothetical protein